MKNLTSSNIVKNMSVEDDEAKWRRKRATTSWICIVYALMIGMEYSSIMTSLFFYLKHDVKVENDQKLWYSVIMCVTALSSSINGILAGKIFDRTRKLKAAMLLFTTCTLIGNLLYTCQISVWFLVCGRFLCGLCDACQPVISGNCCNFFLKNIYMIKIIAISYIDLEEHKNILHKIYS